MLIRTRGDDSHAECVMQAHHAVLSGVLAGAWRPTRLPSLVVQAIGLHDDPWRTVDESPSVDPDRGWPRDFLSTPIETKLDFYATGIDRLEAVHPFVAYLVSRHYTTFAGTRDVDRLCEPEAERRDRLESRLTASQLAIADDAVAWMKYFDVWSLYLCLAGPDGDDASVPPWLASTDQWLEAPDGTTPSIHWRDDTTLVIEPTVFGEPPLGCPIEFRYLDSPASDQRALTEAWADAPLRTRTLELVTSE